MNHLMRELLALLHTIQRTRKVSIGSHDNTYCPQMNVTYIDHLAERVTRYLHHVAAQDTTDLSQELQDALAPAPPPGGVLGP